MIKWYSAHGVLAPLNELDDRHLVNVYLHVMHYKHKYSDNTLIEIQKIMGERLFSNEFVQNGPYQYFNYGRQEWLIWSFEKGRAVPCEY